MSERKPNLGPPMATGPQEFADDFAAPVSNKDPGKVDKAWAAIVSSGVKVGQMWRHNKTDSTYIIKELSVDEARLVAVVTYVGHPNSERRRWTRDLDVFLGKRPDDGTFRFTFIGDPQT